MLLRFYCTGMRGGSTMYRIAEQTAVSNVNLRKDAQNLSVGIFY
ncbi:hypothetical protein MC7420_113 [Coleofasciculus chthonoplastes PCC 7420]|uniref:Uncharacterized protein n=1 Tax=Coleofasciculus chthonoplastes PCC 7420 TaxID=118168 RepID=B4W4N6_9CYAN|nr:hypothetical protein MC7420_113 [Coleofasciculus chthonoplastes PCC 7420]